MLNKPDNHVIYLRCITIVAATLMWSTHVFAGGASGAPGAVSGQIGSANSATISLDTPQSSSTSPEIGKSQKAHTAAVNELLTLPVYSARSGINAVLAMLQAPNSTDIEISVAPLSTVSVPAKTGLSNQLTLTNESNETVCVFLTRGGKGREICVPALGRIILAELFKEAMTIQNKSAVATIIVHGKWL